MEETQSDLIEWSSTWLPIWFGLAGQVISTDTEGASWLQGALADVEPGDCCGTVRSRKKKRRSRAGMDKKKVGVGPKKKNSYHRQTRATKNQGEEGEEEICYIRVSRTPIEGLVNYLQTRRRVETFDPPQLLP